MASPPPSSKELEILKTFRQRISGVHLNPHQKSDLYLLSWLRARDLDLEKAEEMFRKSMQWRKLNNIDEITQWKPPQWVENELPFTICGVDKVGCPVGVVPFGRWDVRKLIEQGHRDVYIKYNDYMNEKILEANENSDEDFVRFNVVFDMEGYSFRQLTGSGCVDTVLEVVKRFEANYPERLSVGFIINAPRIFSILFALIKPLLSPVTLAKIRIFGSNSSKWKLALINHIPADQLPVAYGGSSEKIFNILNSTPSSVGSPEEENLNEMLEVTVGAGERLEIEYKIKHPNSRISWKYKLDAFDIGFSVLYNGKEEVVKYSRVEPGINSDEVENGSLVCSRVGRYTLLFDNTYSLVRPKILHYLITLDQSEVDVIFEEE